LDIFSGFGRKLNRFISLTGKISLIAPNQCAFPAKPYLASGRQGSNPFPVADDTKAAGLE